MPTPRRIVDQLNDEPELDREEETVELEADEAEVEEVEEQEDDGDVEQDEDQDDGGEQEPEPAPRRRAPSRSESTIAALRRRAQEAERRARDLELAQARGGGNQNHTQESEAVREARLAAMDPTERVEFLLNEERAERRRERAMDNFRHQDERDRTQFEAMIRNEPTLKKYADEVEHRLNLLRAQGQNAPRDSVLKFILGERVVAGRSSPKAKAQRAAADKRVASQQVALPKGKGERGSRAGSKSADLEKRLTGVPI